MRDAGAAIMQETLVFSCRNHKWTVSYGLNVDWFDVIQTIRILRKGRFETNYWRPNLKKKELRIFNYRQNVCEFTIVK